ncbi:MAG: cyclic nucleotide-binding domain-containing protein [Thiohalocapsa sp.]|jgi:CRP-like cAMP-binding protein|uniref:Crp/Fnr family transcriptional regulator n=1 Tax=Thiohalocapsa sp. TaxID=2497641 RepID=UPI0025D9E14C|nr:cyclic nucleotide-binding domain-containing protein [Thiohalocapsa sp.]MCG6942466.1 cyclic nucleotide-binding domain-containing protein [Thiohalocapsa sp.]
MNDLNIPEALAQSTLGIELSGDECAALAATVGMEQVAAGETLVHEGEDRRTLFVLAQGKLNVCMHVNDQEEVVYQMRAGECAGTRAFVDGSPRKAALRAEADSLVLTLEPDAFEALVETQPRLVYKVMRAIFRNTHSHLMRVNLESTEMRNYVMKTGGRY